MFTVFVPVGPGESERESLADTLDSLRAHAPGGEMRLILIDDSPRPRSLERLCPGASTIRTGLWDTRGPDPLSAMTAGTIEALKRAQGDFVLKLDTDAVVIAPFAESIHSILSRDRSIGIIGAFDRAAAGGTRDWSMWPPLIRRAR
jgi:glycosyl transferase family 2